MVTTPSYRPIRAVQRARLWTSTWMASQAPLAGKRPEGRWLRPTPYLRSRMAFCDLGEAAKVEIQYQGFPAQVGDEAVIDVAGEEGQLGTGRGLNPPDDEPHWGGFVLALDGSVGGLGHDQRRRPSSSGRASSRPRESPQSTP